MVWRNKPSLVWLYLQTTAATEREKKHVLLMNVAETT
jgi:hypothetical protein